MFPDKAIALNATEKEGFAIAFALLEIAKACDRIAKQIDRLGMNGAVESMGAIEGLTVKIAEGLNIVDDGFQETTEAIKKLTVNVRDGLDLMTDVINNIS